MFCFCFLFIFNDSCQTSYLKIYHTDLRQISGLVECGITFLISRGCCHGNQIFVGFSAWVSLVAGS